MKVFILRSDGSYIAFEGMSQETITEMLAAQGLTCEFIDEAAYRAATEIQR